MKKWSLLLMVIIAIVGLKLYQKKYVRTQEAVRQFFIYQICDRGVLDSFLKDNSLSDVNRLYSQMSADFATHGIQEWQLAHLGKRNNAKLIKYSNWVSNGAIDSCGNQKYTRDQVRDFVTVILGIARTRYEK